MGTWRSLAFCSLAACAAAQSTAGAYGQCGGSGYAGPTACVSGYACTSLNDYYYQCIPGATATTSAPAGPSSSLPTSAPASTTTTPGTGPATLAPGWSWVRAVQSPYYHSYLQAARPTPAPAAGDAAVLGGAASAGQFSVADGQLVYGPDDDGGGQHRQRLYMWVEDPADKTQRALATWFDAAANPYGTFGLSGDTVTWLDPDVARGNAAAFYVCPGAAAGGGEGVVDALFVNTGAYGYETPSGCYDVDIHTYGGATADV